jgi:16S rRNA processing protein RimM
VALTDNNLVILGRISGLFGIKGWFKVHSYTEPREAILGYKTWLLQVGDGWRPAGLAEGKKHGKTVIARLDGVADREKAAAYLGIEVAVSRNDMPKLGAGEYYWADLEGMQVVNKDDRVLGKVSYLLATGANDVLVVQGDQEILIPYLQGDVVKSVDLASGVISVDWDWE